jgi:hypothetical protein
LAQQLKQLSRFRAGVNRREARSDFCAPRAQHPPNAGQRSNHDSPLPRASPQAHRRSLEYRPPARRAQREDLALTYSVGKWPAASHSTCLETRLTIRKVHGLCAEPDRWVLRTFGEQFWAYWRTSSPSYREVDSGLFSSSEAMSPLVTFLGYSSSARLAATIHERSRVAAELLR